MTCAYSFAPYGRTGLFSVLCETCRKVCFVVPNAGEAKVLTMELNQSGAKCGGVE